MMQISHKAGIISGLIVFFAFLAGGFLYRILYRAIDSGIQASIAQKSARTTTATVVRSFASISPAPTGSSDSQRLYTICYTLNGLDQIEADMRAGYEAAEHHRERALGPRCRTTVSTVAGKLRPGDGLQVRYLLANDYQIDIAAVEAFGVELRGNDVRLSARGGAPH